MCPMADRPRTHTKRAERLQVGDILWPTNRQVIDAQIVGTHINLRLVRVDRLMSGHDAQFRRTTQVEVLAADEEAL